MASRARICSTFTGFVIPFALPPRMTRIEITAAAYAALAASATRGLVEPRRSPECGYFIWLAPKALKRLEALRRLSESYSGVILRLARLRSRPSKRDRPLRDVAAELEGQGMSRRAASHTLQPRSRGCSRTETNGARLLAHEGIADAAHTAATAASIASG
jgi:hypothetical protein